MESFFTRNLNFDQILSIGLVLIVVVRVEAVHKWQPYFLSKSYFSEDRKS